MQNKMSNFNYSLRIGQVGLDIDVPLRISGEIVIGSFRCAPLSVVGCRLQEGVVKRKPLYRRPITERVS